MFNKKGLAITTVLTIIAIIAVIAVVAYGIYAFRNGRFPFGGGTGDGDGATEIPIVTEETIQEPVTVDEPQSLLIEIHENKIIYDEDELLLDELEKILQEFENTNFIWTLQDTYRAEKSVYNDVKELLEKLNIVFREN